MIPNFVPLIGSGPNAFSDLGTQSLNWAGFSRATDEANMRRMQEAEQAKNQWFSRLAEMRAQENQRRDAADLSAAEIQRRAMADQLSAGLGAAQNAEAAQRFAQQQKFAERQQTWMETKDKTQREQQNTVLADYAEHLQPQLSDAFQEMKKAEAEQEKAVVSITSKASRAQKLANFPPAEKIRLVGGQYSVGIDPIAKTYYTLTPAELAAVTQANDMLAADNASWLLADKKLKTHSDAYNGYHAQAVKSGMLPEIRGNTVLLRVPELGKTFGQMVEEAKQEPPPTPPPTEDIVTNPILARSQGELGGSWNPNFSGDATVTAPALVAPSGPVWRDPRTAPAAMFPTPTANAASPMFPTPTANPGAAMFPSPNAIPPLAAPTPPRIVAPPVQPNADVGYIPQPTQFLKNVSQTPAAVGRAVQYMFQDPKVVGELSPRGMANAAVGDPEQWSSQVPSGRIRVKSPSGGTGTIPFNQLKVAIAAGYKVISNT
jgi:hypothetical protein